MRFCPMLPTKDFDSILDYCAINGKFTCNSCPYYNKKTSRHIDKWFKFHYKHDWQIWLRKFPIYVTGQRHR